MGGTDLSISIFVLSKKKKKLKKFDYYDAAHLINFEASKNNF